MSPHSTTELSPAVEKAGKGALLGGVGSEATRV